jgi:hypothetical protein
VGGVTVGGEQIGENEKWVGGWKDLAKGVNGTKVIVGVTFASATVLQFMIKYFSTISWPGYTKSTIKATKLRKVNWLNNFVFQYLNNFKVLIESYLI